MATKEKTLHDAFYETLKDVYYAEKQSVRALRKSAKAAEHDDLKKAFTDHAEESAHQVERLQQVFEIIGKSARAKTCEGHAGHHVGDGGGHGGLRQHRSCRRRSHRLRPKPSSTTRWRGTARSRYGPPNSDTENAAKLLGETLEEEKATDALLSEIATKINAGTNAEASSEEAAAPKKQAAKKS